MFTSFWLALLAVFIVSLISFVGLISFSLSPTREKKLLPLLIALSTGALLGDAFLHLLPEIQENGLAPLTASAYVLISLVLFFILERVLHWHHHDIDEPNEVVQHHIKPVGYLNLIADGLHNLIDGLIIGASFLVNPMLGFTTTLAVALHEIPQEIGDFGVLLHAGFSRKWAALFNFLSALTAVLGTIIAFSFNNFSAHNTAPLLALAAGSFIYIAGSDLVPEIHKSGHDGAIAQIFCFLLGLALMAGLLLVE